MIRSFISYVVYDLFFIIKICLTVIFIIMFSNKYYKYFIKINYL